MIRIGCFGTKAGPGGLGAGQTGEQDGSAASQALSLCMILFSSRVASNVFVFCYLPPLRSLDARLARNGTRSKNPEGIRDR